MKSTPGGTTGHKPQRSRPQPWPPGARKNSTRWTSSPAANVASGDKAARKSPTVSNCFLTTTTNGKPDGQVDRQIRREHRREHARLFKGPQRCVGNGGGILKINRGHGGQVGGSGGGVHGGAWCRQSGRRPVRPNRQDCQICKGNRFRDRKPGRVSTRRRINRDFGGDGRQRNAAICSPFGRGKNGARRGGQGFRRDGDFCRGNGKEDP